jgi:hypothetical protein
VSLAIGQIVTERTGFKPGDQIGEWVARCYLDASFAGLRYAYGSSAVEAETNLLAALDVVAEVETEESE